MFIFLNRVQNRLILQTYYITKDNTNSNCWICSHFQSCFESLPEELELEQGIENESVGMVVDVSWVTPIGLRLVRILRHLGSPSRRLFSISQYLLFLLLSLLSQFTYTHPQAHRHTHIEIHFVGFLCWLMFKICTELICQSCLILMLNYRVYNYKRSQIGKN